MYQQVFDPVFGSLGWSALVAALPLLTLFALLGGLRWKAWRAGLASLVVALAVAVFAYGMPASQALLSASEGAVFGLFPIVWIVLNAIWVFKLTELTGWDLVLRRAFGSLSPDQRVQAVIIAFCFGALLEALAGFGTPVAVSAVMLIAVGLPKFKAAAVALVANTAPVAFGAVAIPITTLGTITGLDADSLGAMVGRQTPLLAVVVPFILVSMVDGRRGLREVWPVALVGGVTFAAVQALTANLIAYQIADITASMVGALAIVVLLRVWSPRHILSAEPIREDAPDGLGTTGTAGTPAGGGGTDGGGVRLEAALAVPAAGVAERSPFLAFAPYLIIVALFGVASFGAPKAWLDAHSGVKFPWPGLDIVTSAGTAPSAATFNLNYVSAGGTTLLVAGLLTALMYRIRPVDVLRAYAATVKQFRLTIITVMTVLALAYTMNFSGQTVTLGLFLAGTGGFFAFLSPVVGWLGVAVTGSDTSSNSLFGVLQTTAAEKTGLSPYLLAASNTSGGVLGKMISPQNLAIACAAVGLEGREGDLLRAVLKWSVGLLLVLGVVVLLQSTPLLSWMVVTP